MNELQQTVNARELHAFLESKQPENRRVWHLGIRPIRS